MDGALARPLAPAPTLYIEDMHIDLERTRERVVSEADIQAFGMATGDFNPVHFDEDYASGTMFKGRIAHGVLTAGHISAVIGEELPGPGAVYLKQSLAFMAPVRPGDVVRATCRVTAIDDKRNRISLDCICSVRGRVVLKGEALVMVPSRGA